MQFMQIWNTLKIFLTLVKIKARDKTHQPICSTKTMFAHGINMHLGVIQSQVELLWPQRSCHRSRRKKLLVLIKVWESEIRKDLGNQENANKILKKGAWWCVHLFGLVSLQTVLAHGISCLFLSISFCLIVFFLFRFAFLHLRPSISPKIFGSTKTEWN